MKAMRLHVQAQAEMQPLSFDDVRHAGAGTGAGVAARAGVRRVPHRPAHGGGRYPPALACR